MHANQIDRRRALAVVAAVPAAVALATPALASVGEDAELRQLWQRFVDAEVRFGDALSLLGKAEEAIFDDSAALDPNCHNYRAKLGWIKRRHNYARLEEAEEVASDDTLDIRCEIARVPIGGPLAIAIKLATWAYNEDLDASRRAKMPLGNEGRLDIIESVILSHVYMWAVSQCGFDPLMVAYQAVNHSIVRGKRKAAQRNAQPVV